MTTIGRAVRLRISVVVALLLAIVLAVLPPVPGTGLVAFAEETPPPENPLVVDPLLVGLEASSPEFQAGGSATLTATSSVPVEQIGATIELLDTADGSVVKSCASGTTCVATVSFLTGGPREYVAVVQDVESAPVTVARAAWTVELTTTLDVFGAGQQYKLTAEVNQEVRYTDGAYAVHIVD
ncbi:hypothetical protein, partial [Demequina sp.]|uniref:hypothetical protein n=1 Tax=Demequina sp. TaxID=2050685 RepID=UPI0025C6266A